MRDQKNRDQKHKDQKFKRTFRQQVCPFCVENVQHIDYKDLATLRRFVSERAKIRPRRSSGVCARHQRILAQAIKQARNMALLPFVVEHYR
jgi:small subunit ribosomal protein S18